MFNFILYNFKRCNNLRSPVKTMFSFECRQLLHECRLNSVKRFVCDTVVCTQEESFIVRSEASRTSSENLVSSNIVNVLIYDIIIN